MADITDTFAAADDAQKVKKPDVAAAEKKRQDEFRAQLRGRSAKQPTGAKYK